LGSERVKAACKTTPGVVMYLKSGITRAFISILILITWSTLYLNGFMKEKLYCETTATLKMSHYHLGIDSLKKANVSVRKIYRAMMENIKQE